MSTANDGMEIKREKEQNTNFVPYREENIEEIEGKEAVL